MSTRVVAGSFSRAESVETNPTAASEGGTALVTLGTSLTSAMVSAVRPNMVSDCALRSPAASGALK